MSNNKSFLVLSALGKDKPGIVDRLSKAIFDLGCNITDTRMTVLGGEFALLQMIEGQWNQLVKLEDSIDDLSKKLGLTIITERTEERQQEKPLVPYIVDVISMDHPGIVHHLASFFSSRNINIEDMNTSSYSAAHTGTPMFAVRMPTAIKCWVVSTRPCMVGLPNNSSRLRRDSAVSVACNCLAIGEKRAIEIESSVLGCGFI